MKSKVSLVKSDDHFYGVTNSLEILASDIKDAIQNVSQIVVKINFVSTNYELATTPVEAVHAFVDFVRSFYGGNIIIAEEASGGDTKKAFLDYGFVDLSHEYPDVFLFDLADDETILKNIKCPGGELALHLSKTLVEAPFLVSITRPKTHDTVVVTLGIKNVVVGAISQRFRERVMIHRGKAIHDIMSKIANTVYPNLTILDGTVGMEGDGPVFGTEIHSGWTLGSLDALAADSLATYLMGFDIEDVGYLNMLREKGTGLLFPEDKIKVLGENPQRLLRKFNPHATFETQRKWK
ncbi:DUF362 domain-containing protein [Candidatus Dojkabacteria bacterium]|nr:DUF362 domain-containing protein [Candidatus Dojkabacteria bacterium]